MTVVKFQGVVDVDLDAPEDDLIMIGGADVVLILDRAFPTNYDPRTGHKHPNKVTFAIGDETFSGDLYAVVTYSGYSEWTPGDPCELTAGDHDIKQILGERYNGKVITMWVANEPINTLEDYPIERGE